MRLRTLAILTMSCLATSVLSHRLAAEPTIFDPKAGTSPAKKTDDPKPEAKSKYAVVEVVNLAPVPLVEGAEKEADKTISTGWQKIDKQLEGWQIYSKQTGGGTNGVLDVTVKTGGLVLIACNWDYQGNSGGDWKKERWEAADFAKNGWTDTGTQIISNRNRAFKIFSKTVKTGEQMRLRCNKYEPPYILQPGDGTPAVASTTPPAKVTTPPSKPIRPADPPPVARTTRRPAAAGTAIDFPVSAAARDPNFKPSAPPADLNTVDRPDYQTQPKPLVKSLSSATALMVITGDDGSATGFTQDIIATIDADSRKENVAGIRILRSDGDSTMRTALEEAVRAVRMRYPIWEPGYIDLSFGEKHNRHGGPSAGTAFALLMLSCLEGFELDAKCAVTGDITVDWKVRKVGGVTAKVRGAALDKCLYAAIPEANESVISDLAILHGNNAVAEIQIFSIATLQDAMSIAKKEKDPKISEAIKRFTELQPSLAKFEKLTLQKPETKAALKKVLELAPNHLSARHLLAVAEGKASKTLSVTATIYKLHATMYPYYVLLSGDNKISRSTLPELMTATARKSFNTLRPIAHKDLLPLLTDQSAFIEAMDVFAQRPSNSSWEALKTRWGTLRARFKEVDSDDGISNSLRREGF
jgi:hypothetical protein